MVDVLLRAGADPAALDRNGQTALHLCCEYGQRDCLTVLLSLPASSTCLEIRNYEGKLWSTPWYALLKIKIVLDKERSRMIVALLIKLFNLIKPCDRL